MIIARPKDSASPAPSSANPSANASGAPGSRNHPNAFEIQPDSRIINPVRPSQNPTALAAMSPSSPPSTAPVSDIATTTARTRMPMTSSTTAAPIIVTPSGAPMR